MAARLFRNSHLATLARRSVQCKSVRDWDGISPALNHSLRHSHSKGSDMLGTTILCVRKGKKVIIIGDGQVTLGNEIIKPNVRKVRRLGANVIGGFAGQMICGAVLLTRSLYLKDWSLNSKNTLEIMVSRVIHPRTSYVIERVVNDITLPLVAGQLTRAAVELAKAWRTDKFLRRLDAVMVVSDADISLTITGNGDVLEPYDGVIGIGSGGSYASAAARALIDLPDWDAEAIAKKAMKIAADCCIYTNHNFTIEQIDVSQKDLEDVKQTAVLSS